jgi:hypothetical protein
LVKLGMGRLTMRKGSKVMEMRSQVEQLMVDLNCPRNRS